MLSLGWWVEMSGICYSYLWGVKKLSMVTVDWFLLGGYFSFGRSTYSYCARWDTRLCLVRVVCFCTRIRENLVFGGSKGGFFRVF